MDDFEQRNRDVADSKLWELFVCKAKEAELGRDFVSAVGKICEMGLALSKSIIRFFPTFTLHDESHSAQVCRWMWVLMGEKRKQVTAHETALLLMAACCHDIGMSVSEEQEIEMRSRNYPGWDTYFQENLADDAKYCRTGEISDRMFRNFVRMHHHERIGENLRESDWPHVLVMEELDRDVLLKLCRSHGTELADADLNCREGMYDLRMCAVLLRLADLLDFDAGRTPAALFRQMGLDRPKDAESWRSAEEHQKNRAGKFRESFVNGRIPYVAVYDNPGVEQEIRKYLDWVDRELTNCRNCLSQSASHWKSLELPYKVDDEKVRRKGYAAGKFCMTMDQDKVLDLLTGENLYSDAGVFVRELLQNSIDAVLMRAKQDPDFSLEDGLIQIDTWMDKEANTWFRIRDNGTGMNEHIIQNHFLRVGNSYYTSEEFQYANRHAPKGSYTAISRFGIGILSCFMGDKEDTQLKVSTKRFGEGPKNGIRLDVTGLHGYYFLCKEKDHPEYEDWFPQMPSNDTEDRGYREEPGTTICVNVNLLRMGELRSFREILDKYVQFPEVQVTYNGPDGHKEYPTQQQLMEAVYALNPDGVVKEYVHEIPDTEFEKLKEAFPYYTWEAPPKFSLWYEPFNWLADSEKVMGVRVREAVWEPRVRVREIEDVELVKRLTGLMLHFHMGAFGGDNIVIHGELRDSQGNFPIRMAMEDLGSVNYDSTIRCNIYGDNSIFAEEEKQIWKLINESGKKVQNRNMTIAYHGVLTDNEIWYPYCVAIELLRGDFKPRVNMARDKITELPLELCCCFSMIKMGRFIPKELCRLSSEREFEQILDSHPCWKTVLERISKINVEYNDGILDRLWFAHWKRKNKISIENRIVYAVAGNPSDGKTADFPAGMFVWMKKAVLAVGYRMGSYWLYNENHPFSMWLIDNRASLAEKVPTLYDAMIWAMMLSGDRRKILEILNGTLNALRNHLGNPFRVPDDLILTDADFKDGE